MLSHGILTVSLDFELFWGVRDTLTLENYGAAIAGVHTAIPRLLELFTKYEIHATWAAVGFLYLGSVEEIFANEPALVPTYADDWLNPYVYVRTIPTTRINPRYHFAPDLIRAIACTAHQEVGTHTFSHYYCLEVGQTVEQFRSDMEKALAVAERELGRRPVSLVFPKNQFNPEYLAVCSELGIHAYRGNQNSYAYEPGKRDRNTTVRRALRLLDSYVNITGHHGYSLPDLRARASRAPFDVPASRLVRSWSRRFRTVESLKVRRIQNDLEECAKRPLLYHLWWHPHNFGVDQEENFRQLEEILGYFALVRKQYGMRSMNMGEVAELLAGEHTS